MATNSVRLRYRPLRLGWCVRNGNLEDVQRVLRLTHTLWGGRYNPIIPVGEGTPGAELVDAYRVDALYPAAADASLDRFIEQFPHLRWPGFGSRELFARAMDGTGSALFLDIYHPVRKIFEKYVKDKEEPSVKTTLFEWRQDDPLGLVFLALFGGYPASDEIGKDYAQLVSRNLKAVRTEIATGGPVPADAYHLVTPSGLSSFELQCDRTTGWAPAGFYVGTANEFSDIVNCWNLRAADLDIIFFDPAAEVRLRGLKDAYLTALREDSSRRVPIFGYDIGLWRKEGTQVDLALFGEDVRNFSLGDAIFNGSALRPPLMYIDDQTVLGSIDDFDGTPSLSCELRSKPFYDEPLLHNQSLIVDVRPYTYSRNEDSVFKYPHIPELNDYYSGCFIVHEARSGREGIGAITEATTDSLALRALSVRELVSQIFGKFGMKAEASEAGRIASRLIKQMGGVQSCRVFKIAGVRKLVEKYKHLLSFTRSDAIQTIGQNDPATGRPRFESYEQLYIEKRKGGKLTPQQVFDFLLKKGVFRVGINFRCPNCELQSWTPLDDIATEITCELCGKHFNVTTQLKDRDWAYRRSGLFGREDHQEGAIPVALTLQQIDTVLHSGAIYMTATTLEPAGANIARCETDFVVIGEEDYFDKIEVAIGEAKSSGEITTEDVVHLAQVADALPKQRFSPFIIFSKTGSFSTDEIARCRKAQPATGLRVILLSSRELEPYRIYERAAKEFEMKSTAVSLDHLARATHDIYFEPRPKRIAQPRADPIS
jgi:hypothetical protein